MSEYKVMVRDRGQLTLPSPIRTQLNVEKNDVLTAVRIGDSILLTPRHLRVDELTEQLAAIFEEEGVTSDDLMEGLAEEREAIWQRKWAHYHAPES